MGGQRADARRNYALLLTVAEQAVVQQGVDASLEQIARTAGVGSGTVRRHFPTRRALLEAVFRKQVDTLSEQAHVLAGHPDGWAALLEWLDSAVSFAASTRGLAEALKRDRTAGPGEVHEHCASVSVRLTEAGEPLVRRAADAGALAPDVTITDLLDLVTGIALAVEHHSDTRVAANRLLHLAITGIGPAGRSRRRSRTGS